MSGIVLARCRQKQIADPQRGKCNDKSQVLPANLSKVLAIVPYAYADTRQDINLYKEIIYKGTVTL